MHGDITKMAGGSSIVLLVVDPRHIRQTIFLWRLTLAASINAVWKGLFNDENHT
jgi:hypothetical protein